MTELATTAQAKELHRKFTEDVMAMPSGEKIKICQQCGTCTGSCPTSYLMEYGPREVIAAFRAGMIDRVVKSNTIWLCTSCYYCTVRCPAGIKITDLMYELKRMAIKYDLAPKESKNPAMTKIFIDSVRKHGRNHELELMAKYMMTKDWGMPFKFWRLGLKLLAAGRMPLAAKNIRGRDELQKISAYLEAEGGEGPMKYLYYPGCSAEATGKAYDVSTRVLMEKLGVELVELPDWSCCGATSYFSVRELDSFAIAARNMAIAQEMGESEICVICNACYTSLAKANRYMADDPHVFEAVNGALGAVGRKYDGQVKIRHIMDILINDIGLEAIEERVTRRLTGIRVAPYYGCQFSRPMGTFDDMQFPTTMDRLFEAMGADVITDFDAKTDCCGGMMMLTKRDGALRLCHELLVAVRQYKADVVVAACPLCEMNLEGYQRQVNQAYGTDFNIPVMYFTQLAGLALGADPKQLAIDKQVVSCDPLLAAIPA